MSISCTQQYTIALGLSNNVDYIITFDSSLLEDSIIRLSINAEDVHYHPVLDSEKSVLCNLLYCIQQQMGGERYVDSPQVLKQLASHFPYTKSIGGTAARAANILAEKGYHCLLHCISFNDEERQLIHPLIAVTNAEKPDRSTFHCIMQYNQGLLVQVGKLQISAKSSNRIILNNNPAIKTMNINRRFFTMAGSCKMLLLSGLNAISDATLLNQRLIQLAGHLSSLKEGPNLMYEDGCFHNPQNRLMVIEQLRPYISQYSMNEDEFLELTETTQGKIEMGLESLRKAYRILSVPIMIVHTKSWVIACGPGARTFKRAMQEGINLATCHLLEASRIPEYLALNTEGLSMQERCNNEEELCCLPCYEIDTKELTTVGLGDAFVAGFLSIGASEHDKKTVC